MQRYIAIILIMSLLIPYSIGHLNTTDNLLLAKKPPRVLGFEIGTFRDGISFTVALSASAKISLRIYSMSGSLVGSSYTSAAPGSPTTVSAKASDGDGDHIVMLTIRNDDQVYLRMRAKIDLRGIIDPPDFPPLVDMKYFNSYLSGDEVRFSSLALTDQVSPYPDFPAYYIIKYDGQIVNSGSLGGYSSAIPSISVKASPGLHTYYLRIEDSDSNHYYVEYTYTIYIDAPPQLNVNYDVSRNDPNNATVMLNIYVMDNENPAQIQISINGTNVYNEQVKVNTTIKVPVCLPPGIYEINVTAIDPFGLNVTQSLIVTLEYQGNQDNNESGSSSSEGTSSNDLLSQLNEIISAAVVLALIAFIYRLFFDEE